jgi:uncharacterized protein YecE (DUF72 family)
MKKVWIGTSGWTYEAWRGPFYPGNIPDKNLLGCYAGRFSTTEINASFYRTPTIEAVREWRDRTPNNFLFSWKASKFITHWKRLTEKCENSIDLMETRLKVLGPKLSTVLFQLPPNFSKDQERLRSFLKMLSRRRRYAFEFRHKSWYDDAVFALLQESDIALCISDHRDAPSPWVLTASHVYVRAHGPGGSYQGSYSTRELRRWARAISAWRAQKREVMIYFDNDQKAAAPMDADRLLGLLDERDERKVVARKRPERTSKEIAGEVLSTKAGVIRR